MKAAVCRGPGRLAIEEIEEPTPQAGEVKLRLAATGLCGTDRSILEGHLPAPLPIVLGHEGAGTVVEVGPGVAGLAPGDRVVCTILVSCGRCYPCVRGEVALCERNALLTGKMLDGTTRLRRGDEAIHSLAYQASFAEYAVVPECCAVKIAADAPLAEVVGLACGVSTGLGAAMLRAPVAPGSRVLVVGAGGVGLATMMGARTLGAAQIFAYDRVAEKAKRAVLRGLATCALDSPERLVEEVRAATAGRGVDFAFDAVGAPGTLELAVEATRAGGEIVVIGHMQAVVTATLDTRHLLRQKRITGTFGGSIVPHRHIPDFVEMHRCGRLALGSLLDAHYRLDELPRAFDELARGAITRGVVLF